MELSTLIRDYVSEVEECLRMLAQEFGTVGAAPRSGRLGKASYKFHGVGCLVEFPDRSIDFDFAPKGMVGFDAWRLCNYAQQFPAKYPACQDPKTIECLIAEGLAEGRFIKIYEHQSLLKLSTTH